MLLIAVDEGTPVRLMARLPRPVLAMLVMAAALVIGPAKEAVRFGLLTAMLTALAGRVIEPLRLLVQTVFALESKIGLPEKVTALTSVVVAPETRVVPEAIVREPVPTGPLVKAVRFTPKPATFTLVRFVLVVRRRPPAAPPTAVPPV